MTVAIITFDLTVYVVYLYLYVCISVMVKKQKAVERTKEQLEKLLVQQTDKVLLTYHSLTSYYQPVRPSVRLSVCLIMSLMT